MTKPPQSSVGVPLGPRAADVLKLAYRAGRSVLLEGHTGVGKSELVRQVAESLKIRCVVLDLALLEPPDLVGLPVVADGRTSYAPPRLLPADGRGILLLEELNRAERHLQSTAFQLLTTGKLHEYQLPPGWVTFAAVNPDDANYEVTPLDPALKARFLTLKVTPDLKHWQVWAARAGVHPAVMTLARGHDKLFEGAPPRTWKYVSDVLRAIPAHGRVNRTLLADALAGYLPATWVEVLMAELVRSEGVVFEGFDPEYLLERYHEDAAVRDQFQGVAAAGRTDVLEQVVGRMIAALTSPDADEAFVSGRFSLAAFEQLARDLPGDWREQLQQVLAGSSGAAARVGIRPAVIVAAEYATGPHYRTVSAWAGDAFLHHRVALLVRAVCEWLDMPGSADGLARSPAALASLDAFRKQANPRWSAPLDAGLKKWGLTLPSLAG